MVHQSKHKKIVAHKNFILRKKIWLSIRLRFQYKKYIRLTPSKLDSEVTQGKQKVNTQGKRKVNTQWKHKVNTQGKHKVNTQGKQKVNTQGKHKVNTQGKHKVNTQGKHKVNTQGKHKVNTQGKHKVNTQGKQRCSKVFTGVHRCSQGDHKSPGLWSVKTLNMQDKVEGDWFKPSKHDVIHLRWFKNIQLQNPQQNLNL